MTLLIRTLNGKYIGKSIFCQIANYIITITIKIFLLFSLPKALESFRVMNIIFVLNVIFRLYVLIRAGQKYSRTITRAKEATQDIIFKYGQYKKQYIKVIFYVIHFSPISCKKHHSTLEMKTFKAMLLLSYLAPLDNKPRTCL